MYRLDNFTVDLHAHILSTFPMSTNYGNYETDANVHNTRNLKETSISEQGKVALSFDYYYIHWR